VSERRIPFLVPVRKFAESTSDGSIKWIDGNKLWVQLYPYDSWDHPMYGVTTVNKYSGMKFAENFNKNVYGQDILTDYEHGLDKAKGRKASGKYLKIEPRNDGVYGLIQFTEEAVKEIENGEWNYFSTEHYPKWTHPSTGDKHMDVITGGALTNKPWVKGMLPLNFSEVFIEEHPELVGEHSDLETHDPGFPPDPRTNEDDSAETGSRRDTPPAGEDGSVPDRSKTVENKGGEMDDLEKQLREALNLDESADIIKAVSEMKDEVEPLREVARQHSEKRRFSEEFPKEWERMQRLEQDHREDVARQFSETLAQSRVMEKDGDKDKPTTIGLSSLAIEKGREMALKFSEGSVSFADFKDFTNSIFNNGLVDYGTTGSSSTDGSDGGEEIPENDPRRFSEANLAELSGKDVRLLFGEAVMHHKEKLMEDDKLDDKAAYRQAVDIAAERYPELYTRYMQPLGSR
jgi:hypothetical protein